MSDSSSCGLSDSEDNLMPWEDEDFVPRTKSGVQKSPNIIRGELQRYIDACKVKGITQTSILEEMCVNNNSFRKFMNPKIYKTVWSATQNSTYEAAGRLLARVQYEKEQQAKQTKSTKKTPSTSTTGKRKADTSTATTNSVGGPVNKKSKIEMKTQAQALIDRINAVPNVSVEDGVYDTCPQLVTKIKNFLQRDGMTKALLLTNAFGNINPNALSRFLAGKKQDQCGNQVYPAAYVFFEQLRILEGQKKSKARLKNEAEEPNGFSIERERPRWVVVPRGF